MVSSARRIVFDEERFLDRYPLGFAIEGGPLVTLALRFLRPLRGALLLARSLRGLALQALRLFAEESLFLRPQLRGALLFGVQLGAPPRLLALSGLLREPLLFGQPRSLGGLLREPLLLGLARRFGGFLRNALCLLPRARLLGLCASLLLRFERSLFGFAREPLLLRLERSLFGCARAVPALL